MFNVSALLDKLIVTRVAMFNSHRCIRHRHKEYPCRLCGEICPGQAITLQGTMVQHQEAKCLGCGLCAAVCKNGAFELNEPTYENIMIRTQKHRVLVLNCSNSPACEGALEIPCLGYLEENLLAGLANQGVKIRIQVDLKNCKNCRFSKGSAALESRILRSQQLVQALGHEMDIANTEDNQGACRPEPISRAEFFAFFKNKARETLAQLGEAEGENQSDDGNQRCLPEKRRLFIEALGKGDHPVLQGRIPAEGMPMAELEIDRKCTGCGNCTVFCPTGALQKTVRDGGIILTHRMAHCINCRLCNQICPERAITYAGQLDLQFLANQSVREVIRVSADTCVQCGKVYHQANARGLCPACANRAKLDAAIDGFFD